MFIYRQSECVDYRKMFMSRIVNHQFRQSKNNIFKRKKKKRKKKKKESLIFRAGVVFGQGFWHFIFHQKTIKKGKKK